MSTRSVVKHSYIMAGPKAKQSARAHLNYVQHRSGQDKEPGGCRRFFDRDNDEVNSGRFKDKVSKFPDRGVVLHKLILSPGVQNVDLRQYTREVMDQIAERKGLDLEWQGVVHTNTDHDHIHVSLLGRDRNGKTIRLTKDDYAFAREIGDRYIRRHHEFDRYFDNSIDRLLKDEHNYYNKDFDLDSLFKPYAKEPEKKKGRARNEKSKENKQPFKSEIKEKQPYQPSLYRRKPRRQRLLEARGRADIDYFHNLYASRMARQQLQNLQQARPDLDEYIKRELAALDRVDAERRANGAREVAELERILGIVPKKTIADQKPSADGDQGDQKADVQPEERTPPAEAEQDLTEVKSDHSAPLEHVVEIEQCAKEDSDRDERDRDIELEEPELAGGGQAAIQMQELLKRHKERQEEERRRQEEQERADRQKQTDSQKEQESERTESERQQEQVENNNQRDERDREDEDREKSDEDRER